MANSERFVYLDRLGPAVELAYCWHFDQGDEHWYRNPVHGLTLIERGEIAWDTPDGLVRGVAGDLVYNRPAPRGHYRVCAPAMVYVVGLQFAAQPRQGLRPFLSGAGPLPARLPLGTAFAAMRALMETLCIEVPREGAEHRLIVQATVYQMLALIARVMGAQPSSRRVVDDWERARIRLASVDGYRVKIADLARAMDLSVQYFNRGFRHRFGESPKAYQMRSRIQETVRRLRETDELFKVIAYDMGFRDPKILYRAICRQLGLGPTQLRQLPAQELRARMPRRDIPFLLNSYLVPPGTPANWPARHRPKGYLRLRQKS